MKVEVGFPPNIEKIAEKFDLDSHHPVFTYGDTIYSPHGAGLSDDLVAHEMIHMAQQTKSPEIWWDRYLTDEEFRLDQELQAYGVQYGFICLSVKDRNARHRQLFRLATDLSSTLYGSLIPHSVAMRSIRAAAGVKDKHYK